MYLRQWIEAPLYDKAQGNPVAHPRTGQRRLQRYSNSIQDACTRWESMLRIATSNWSNNGEEVRGATVILVQSIAAHLKPLIDVAETIVQHVHGANVNPDLVKKLRSVEADVETIYDQLNLEVEPVGSQAMMPAGVPEALFTQALVLRAMEDTELRGKELMGR